MSLLPSLTCLLTAAALLGCGASQTQTMLIGDGPVVVPFTQQGGHVVVDVFIDGQGPYLFQVDTYASIDACIDDDLAAELELPVTGTTQNSDGLTISTRDLVTLGELRLGEATFRDLTTLVDDYSWLGTRRGRPVQGLVGFTAFESLLVTFDYPGSRLVLEHGELSAQDAGVLAYSSRTGSPDVDLTLGELPLLVGIDTGFDGTLLLQQELAERLELASPPRKIGSARVAYTSFDLLEARLAEPVAFAGHSLPRLEVLFREGATHNLMGRGILQVFAVTFDQQHSLVRFALPGATDADEQGDAGAEGPREAR